VTWRPFRPRPLSVPLIMDFPEAWAFVRATGPMRHDVGCSWRSTEGALLCDCHVLGEEYERRMIAMGARVAEPTP